MEEHKTVQFEGSTEVGMEVEGMNPRENQQACKPNLHRYQEQVGGRM